MEHAGVREHRSDVLHVLRLLVVRRSDDDPLPAGAEPFRPQQENAAGIPEADRASADPRVERLRVYPGSGVVEGDPDRSPDRGLVVEEPDGWRRLVVDPEAECELPRLR